MRRRWYRAHTARETDPWGHGSQHDAALDQPLDGLVGLAGNQCQQILVGISLGTHEPVLDQRVNTVLNAGVLLGLRTGSVDDAAGDDVEDRIGDTGGSE